MTVSTDTARAVTGLTVDQRLVKVEAALEIQNLMGRYAFWHTANMHRECLDLFAMTMPDVRAEMMWGVYEGADSLERLYPGFHVAVDGDTRGKMHMHTLTTPVIEVADDGRTAKAVWISPGHETMSFTEGTDTAEALWAWCKYAADFIVEGGRWKIWHLHVYGLFMAPYNTSWVDHVMPLGAPPMVEQYPPDRPPTTGWVYSPDVAYVNEPAPPEPYSAFDPATAY